MIRSQEANNEVKIISESREKMLLPNPEVLDKDRLSLVISRVCQQNTTQSNI